MDKVKLGKIHANIMTMEHVLQKVEEYIDTNTGGYVVTPNVDHIVLAENNIKLVEAYASASLSLADGKPLIWMSQILGNPLPEKISGSDLIIPLMKLASDQGYKVYLLGAAPGVADKAAEILVDSLPALNIVGTDSPPLGFDMNERKEREVLNAMLKSSPDIVLMALGAPKQELLMHRWNSQGIKPLMFGIGASLDFVAGNLKRAPKWMSNEGLEWFYRILQDPKRMIHRYLVRDRAIIGIFYKMLKAKRGVVSES